LVPPDDSDKAHGCVWRDYAHHLGTKRGTDHDRNCLRPVAEAISKDRIERTFCPIISLVYIIYVMRNSPTLRFTAISACGGAPVSAR